MLSTRPRQLLVAAAVLLLAGCGGASGAGGASVSADTWVGAVCQDVGSYTQVAGRTPDLTSSISSGDLAGAQQKMSAYLGSLSTASTTLADSIGKDGTPDVDNGSQIVTSIQKSLSSLAGTYAAQKKKIDAADPKDATAFGQTLSDVGQAISDASKKVGSSLDSVTGGSNSELSKAYDKNATCQKLDDSSTS